MSYERTSTLLGAGAIGIALEVDDAAESALGSVVVDGHVRIVEEAKQSVVPHVARLLDGVAQAATDPIAIMRKPHLLEMLHWATKIPNPKAGGFNVRESVGRAVLTRRGTPFVPSKRGRACKTEPLLRAPYGPNVARRNERGDRVSNH